jgi:hypothetical protein
MTISGTLLYATELSVFTGGQWLYGGVRVLDISNPATPVQIGYYHPSGSSYSGIVLQGPYAYISNFGLEIIDITNPTSPTLVYADNNLGYIPSIAISGTHLYAGRHAQGLDIFDITTPTMPIFVQNISGGMYGLGVRLNGAEAYIESLGYIGIYDVSDPQSPNLLSTYSEQQALGKPEVHIENDRMYVAHGTAGFHTVDVSDPANPNKLGEYGQFGELEVMALENDTLYTAEDMEGISIAAVNESGGLTNIGYYPLQKYFDDIAVQNAYIYAIAAGSDLWIIDATDPTSPTLVTQLSLSLSTHLHQIVVDGDYAYVIGNPALHIIDIADPQNSSIVAEWGNGGEFIDTKGDYAFIGIGSGLVQVVDVSSAISPTLVNIIPMTNEIEALTVVDDYLYVAELGTGIRIIDVSDVMNPWQIGLYPFDIQNLYFTNDRIRVVGSYLFFSYHNLVSMIDISMPSNPLLVSEFSLRDGPKDIIVDESRVFAAADWHGLFILSANLPGTLSLSDGQVLEGDAGLSTMVITVTLSAAYTDTVTVDYATMPIGSAIPHVDYIPISNTLTFDPGEISKTIQISIIDDELDELDETFEINLSNPVNAMIADGQAIGTILDDDDAPLVSMADVAGQENVGTIWFTVTLSEPSSKMITINYATSDLSATANLDYIPVSGTITFEPGVITQTIPVTILDDMLYEGDESFVLSLSDPVNAVVVDEEREALILDDDEKKAVGFYLYLPMVVKDD